MGHPGPAKVDAVFNTMMPLEEENCKYLLGTG
jgi:hypothetical protein